MRYARREGFFELESLPSQVQVAVSHGFQVRENLRGQGNAKRLHVQQIMQAAEMGYDYVVCTVTGENIPQHKALEATGWKMLHEFYNTRVGQPTQLWGRPITSEDAELPVIAGQESESEPA